MNDDLGGGAWRPLLDNPYRIHPARRSSPGWALRAAGGAAIAAGAMVMASGTAAADSSDPDFTSDDSGFSDSGFSDSGFSDSGFSTSASESDFLGGADSLSSPESSIASSPPPPADPVIEPVPVQPVEPPPLLTPPVPVEPPPSVEPSVSVEPLPLVGPPPPLTPPVPVELPPPDAATPAAPELVAVAPEPSTPPVEQIPSPAPEAPAPESPPASPLPAPDITTVSAAPDPQPLPPTPLPQTPTIDTSTPDTLGADLTIAQDVTLPTYASTPDNLTALADTTTAVASGEIDTTDPATTAALDALLFPQPDHPTPTSQVIDLTLTNPTTNASDSSEGATPAPPSTQIPATSPADDLTTTQDGSTPPASPSAALTIAQDVTLPTYASTPDDLTALAATTTAVANGEIDTTDSTTATLDPLLPNHSTDSTADNNHESGTATPPDNPWLWPPIGNRRDRTLHVPWPNTQMDVYARMAKPAQIGMVHHLMGRGDGDGGPLLDELYSSRYPVNGTDDWHEAIREAMLKMRDIALTSDPLTPEQIQQYYPVRTPEELAAIPDGIGREVATQFSDRNKAYHDELITGGLTGFTSLESGCWLMCDKQGQARVVGPFSLGTHAAVRMSDLPSSTLEEASRLAFLHCHPFAGWDATGLSTGDQGTARAQAKDCESRGYQVPVGIASVDLLSGGVTYGRPAAEGWAELALLPGRGPTGDLMFLDNDTQVSVRSPGSPGIQVPDPSDIGPAGSSMEIYRQAIEASRVPLLSRLRNLVDRAEGAWFDLRLQSLEENPELATSAEVSGESEIPSGAEPEQPEQSEQPRTEQDERQQDSDQHGGGRSGAASNYPHVRPEPNPVDYMFPGGRPGPPVELPDLNAPDDHPVDPSEFDPNQDPDFDPVDPDGLGPEGFPGSDPKLERVLAGSNGVPGLLTSPQGQEEAPDAAPPAAPDEEPINGSSVVGGAGASPALISPVWETVGPQTPAQQNPVQQTSPQTPPVRTASPARTTPPASTSVPDPVGHVTVTIEEPGDAVTTGEPGAVGAAAGFSPTPPPQEEIAEEYRQDFTQTNGYPGTRHVIRTHDGLTFVGTLGGYYWSKPGSGPQFPDAAASPSAPASMPAPAGRSTTSQTAAGTRPQNPNPVGQFLNGALQQSGQRLHQATGAVREFWNHQPYTSRGLPRGNVEVTFVDGSVGTYDRDGNRVSGAGPDWISPLQTPTAGRAGEELLQIGQEVGDLLPDVPLPIPIPGNPFQWAH